jgi:hypothetical protein
VIDDIEKAMALVERMQAALPMRAFATEGVRRALRQNAKRDFPHECGVTEIRYMGEEDVKHRGHLHQPGHEKADIAKPLGEFFEIRA